MLWRTKKSDVGVASQSSEQSGAVTAPAMATESAQSFGVANVDVVSRRPEGAYVIPRRYRISGRVVTSRPVVVEGRLEGPGLVAPSVYVGTLGHLDLPVQATHVSVEGVVSAPIAARDLVEVLRGGEIKGDVEAGALRIAPGGIVSGARLAIGPLRSV